MEKRYRIAQLYGYLVCLVTVIAVLISLASLVGAMFDLSDPLHARGMDGRPDLTSFEAYKMDVLGSARPDPQSPTPGYVPDDQTLRTMYEAAKADRIQSVRLQAYRSLTVSGLIIIVCIALFTTHWIWVRKLARAEA